MENIYHLDFLAKERQEKILNTFGIRATINSNDRPKQNRGNSFLQNLRKVLNRGLKNSRYNLKRILINEPGA